MHWLDDIENRKKRRETDRVFFGCYDLQRDADEEKLIAEVKRLRKELGSANDAIILLKTRLKQLQKAVEIEHDQGESFLMQIKELQEENATLRKDKERIEFENNQFRRYVVETGCSYTQTESDCECDYGYPWPCDHCPIVEHNRDLFD